MGRLRLLWVLGLALFASRESAFADDDPLIPPVLVSHAVERAFIPVGYDDNDRVQLTVTGTFPNGCFRVGPATAEVDVTGKRIIVHQQAYVYFGYCLQVIVPFTQTIDVGILRAQHYTVEDKANGAVLGNLTVKRASRLEADDFLYAPITSAAVLFGSGKPVLSLLGSFTDRCMHLKEVAVEYHKDVVVVLPIAEMKSGGTICGVDRIRFQRDTALSETLKGPMLVHIRSLDGQALNLMVDFP